MKLAIKTDEVSLWDAANIELNSWPPPDDLAIVTDDSGQVISRFADPFWNLTPWTRTATRMSFDSVGTSRSIPLDSHNARVFKLVILSWLHGRTRVRAPTTLMSRYELMRPIFVLCTQQGVRADRLWRHPAVVDLLPSVLGTARAREVVALLHDVYLQRRTTTFLILLPDQIAELYARIPRHSRQQTAYIPPRIWMYLMQRCKACLDEYMEAEHSVAELFRFAREAYRANLRSGECLYADGVIHGREPFTTPTGNRGARTTVTIHGPFQRVAASFGVDALLSRWILPREEGSAALKISHLSKYLSLVQLCGQIYLSSFALTRVKECVRLRAGCVEVRTDSAGDRIVLIRGKTTKTLQEDTYWIASDFCVKAVEAMESVSSLRFECAAEDPRSPVTPDDYPARPLAMRAYEPWIPHSGDATAPIDVFPGIQSFGREVERFDRLLDSRQMTITAEDIAIARSVTPGLDLEEYAVGKIWPVAWHQLRRTGAVNMNSSNLVSDLSLQLQLKHSSEAMTRYYSQGYHHLDICLDESSRKEFLSALYDKVAAEISGLHSPDLVSPYGEEYKATTLSLVSDNDHQKLVQLAKSGSVHYRRTLLGACTNPAPCKLGGVESLAACVGMDGACPFVLFDRRKLPMLKSLRDDLLALSHEAAPGSPLKESVEVQIASIEKVERSFS